MLSQRAVQRSRAAVPSRGFWAFLSAPQTSAPSLTIPYGNNPQAGALLKEGTRVTTLTNGVRVVSEDNGGFAANVGIFTAVGTRHEPVRGLSQLRSRLLFQSTESRFNPVRVMRDASESSCLLQCDIARETTGFSVAGLRENIPNGFEILSDLARNGKFNEWEVEDQKYWLNQLTNDADAGSNLEEVFHGAAYNLQSLGKPQSPSSNVTSSIGRELLKDWNNVLFANPANIVIAGANIPHDALVSLSSKTFGDLKKSDDYVIANSTAKYVGGDSRAHSEGEVKVALGFGTPGFAQLGKKYVVYNLLHFLLGSGSDFSAGGPGKGIHTRLSQAIAHTNHSVMSVGAQIRPYSDSGLFYIEATVGHDGKRITDQIVDQFVRLDKIAQKDFKNDDELTRAKNRLKSHYFQTSEDEAINVSDLAYQVLLQGSRPTSSELFSVLDQVSGADVTSAVRSMLSTKPTFVAIGNLTGVPAYHEIERHFSK